MGLDMINRVMTGIGFILMLGIMSAGGTLLLLRMLVDGLGYLIRVISK